MNAIEKAIELDKEAREQQTTDALRKYQNFACENLPALVAFARDAVEALETLVNLAPEPWADGALECLDKHRAVIGAQGGEEPGDD